MAHPHLKLSFCIFQNKIMKSFVITSILFISITLTGHPQSIVTIPIEQNPLFEVSTNRVNLSGVDLSQRLVLGGDISSERREWSLHISLAYTGRGIRRNFSDNYDIESRHISA